ncbi:MAG: tRNA preQ1(34) S-adenosylmethionine ribosyltransferase-isomerase QueA [Anaerolineae bacterium]
MKTSHFDYDLPSHLIAQTPVEPRHDSRLMVLSRREGTLEHRRFRDIVAYLRPGDLLVCNDSRVIPARLYGRKSPTEGKVELLLLHQQGEGLWEALVRGRKVRVGSQITVGEGEIPPTGSPEPNGVVGHVLEPTESGAWLIRFSPPIEPVLEDLGVVPLPPYIHQPLADPERYQTVYARVKGSAAAPTAGLHFTPELIEEIQAQGVEFAFVTLHIGLDTFRPVGEERVEDHHIHREYCELTPEVAKRISRVRKEGRRVIAVGTTVVRVLETAAANLSPKSLLPPFRGWTDLFIYPGFQFTVVDALITNFHLPRSPLLLLVSAFAGRDLIMRAYQEAIRLQYRFYSFGDATFII